MEGKARGPWVLGTAALALALLTGLAVVAGMRLRETEKEVLALKKAGEILEAHTQGLRAEMDEKERASAEVRSALSDMARAKRSVYEAGLSLQEEKRLLEKQLEIMTTYLEVDEEAGKIHLMRGDQKLMSFPFSPPLRAYGDEKTRPAPLCRVISRERYAYTERGKAETTGSGLKWDPPQIGEGRRGSPLGEYVLFTDGPLVLHAPSSDAALHGSYPHVCAGLTQYSARRLYESVFIGNKLSIKKAPGRPGRTGPKAGK